MGGQNDAQLMTFVGQPSGTFTLYWNNGGSGPHQTGPISYTGNGAATASAVQSRVGRDRRHRSNATAISGTQILIEFVGAQADQDQPQITVGSAADYRRRGRRIDIETTVHGATGEFRVNDTTANNQMFPAIAMNASGAFVITWTSYGQDGDAAYQSNVYAKTYESSESLDLSSQRTTLAGQYNYQEASPVSVDNLIVTTDNPANHVVAPGSGYDGVVEIIVQWADGEMFLGSGTLLSDGRHILTAAHVVYDDSAGAPSSPAMPRSILTCRAARWP